MLPLLFRQNQLYLKNNYKLRKLNHLSTNLNRQFSNLNRSNSSYKSNNSKKLKTISQIFFESRRSNNGNNASGLGPGIAAGEPLSITFKRVIRDPYIRILSWGSAFYIGGTWAYEKELQKPKIFTEPPDYLCKWEFWFPKKEEDLGDKVAGRAREYKVQELKDWNKLIVGEERQREWVRGNINGSGSGLGSGK